MSKLTLTLNVSQPNELNYSNQGEVFRVVQKCESCNGQGGQYIDSRSPSFIFELGEHYRTCKVCNGTSSLVAKINIQWEPYDEV